MREIKFRAWDLYNKEMFNSLSMNFQNSSLTSIFDLPNDEIEDLELMQYTGLKDKNDVEIYEGDICKTVHSAFRDDDNTIGIVEFYNGRFSRKIKYPSGQYNYHDLFNLHCEVIGNIYENPELLN